MAADFLSMAHQPLVGQGIKVMEASQLHSETPHSVGVLWTSDHPDTETSTRQHKTLTRDIRASGGIGTRNPSKMAAPDTRLTPRGHRDQLLVELQQCV